MTKKELVPILARNTGLTQADTRKFIDGFIELVEDALTKGESIQIKGFGTFETIVFDERSGIDPQTKKPIQLQKRRIVKFRVGQTLKNAVK